MAASTAIRSTVAGWTTPLQWTVVSNGNTVEWYTPRLSATTLAGAVQAAVWVSESNAAANLTVRLQIDVVNNAGTLVSTFGAATANVGAPVGTASQISFLVAGPDTAIAAGNRLRLRFFIDDFEVAMGSGHTATLLYNVATPDASGDSYVTFPVTLSTFSTTLTQTGVASTTAFGTPTVRNRQIVTATGVPATSQFGSHTIVQDQQLTPAAYADPDLFGSPTVVPGTVVITTSVFDDSVDQFGAAAVFVPVQSRVLLLFVPATT